MKLIYFVSPYNLLCKKTKSSYPMTVEGKYSSHLSYIYSHFHLPTKSGGSSFGVVFLYAPTGIFEL